MPAPDAHVHGRSDRADDDVGHDAQGVDDSPAFAGWALALTFVVATFLVVALWMLRGL
jgi:hypothetical protein